MVCVDTVHHGAEVKLTFQTHSISIATYETTSLNKTLKLPERLLHPTNESRPISRQVVEAGAQSPQEPPSTPTPQLIIQRELKTLSFFPEERRMCVEPHIAHPNF